MEKSLRIVIDVSIARSSTILDIGSSADRPSDCILKPTAFSLELVIVALIVHSRGA